MPAGASVNLLACWCFWKVLWTGRHELGEPGKVPAVAAAPAPDAPDA